MGITDKKPLVDRNLNGKEAEVKKLAISQIRIDGGTQIRLKISEEVVKDYADVFREETGMPPVVVFWDGNNYWLADGFHRFHAAMRVGNEEIAAEVYQGNQRDAILYAVGANARYGLRRNRADKRAAIEVLLSDEDWGLRADKWIADQCRVSNHLVTRVRREFEASQLESNGNLQSGSRAGEPEPKSNTCGTRLTRNGKVRPATYNRKSTSTSAAASPAGEPDKSGTGSDDSGAGTEGVEEPHDSLGQPLTEENRPAFALIPEIQAIGREIDALIRRAAAEKEGPAGAYIDINCITAQLKSAKRALIVNLPFANCPYCEGHSCRQCRDSGYITRTIYDQLPKELKQPAGI